MTQPTDWTNLPLHGNGRSLVEASAGTGKTWTITVLYLRLLLEQELTPRQIVVSTFTNAAAAELRERLRSRVLWALAEVDAAEAGSAPTSAEAGWLRKRWQDDLGKREHDARRLLDALAELDAAPVCTLHALCSRILADHPFVSGSLFRKRTVVDGNGLERALADDLWRTISQGAVDSELPRLAEAADITRTDVRKYIRALLQPSVVVAGLPCAALLEHIESHVGDPNAWGALLAKVTQTQGLLRQGGALQKAWDSLSQALLCDSGDPGQVIGRHYQTLLDARDMRGVNQAGKDNTDVRALAQQSASLIESIGRLQVDRWSERPLRDFLSAAQKWCQAEMAARLEAAQQSTFDLLLHGVLDALNPGEGRRALADALWSTWPVALVDEFQDTDPVQFGILDAIYRDENARPRGRLVMIGDPKQAIYRFRGGDVAAYARARAGVTDENHLTLGVNFRSTKEYVTAINAFYARVGRQLGPPGSTTPIEYHDVQASPRTQDSLIDASTGHQVVQPLVLHIYRQSPQDDKLEAAALRACASQIIRALSPRGYRVGSCGSRPERALQPKDIAVLLPTNSQIAQLARMLRTRGVPCVAQSAASVFSSDAARDLQLLLHAALHPDDPGVLRAAAATRVWGASLGDLRTMRHDAARSDDLAQTFRQLHRSLHDRGPMAFVNALLEYVAARLLDTIEGERLLTDLRHLGELLQEAFETHGSGERLSAWLSDQTEESDGEEGDGEARALRLESDAGRVALMTLHASKGLEFQIVFLPMMWKHSRPHHAARGVHLLADDGGQNRYVVLDPAKDEVKKQEYEERFRILYVALTRARLACHLFLAPRPGDAAAKRAIPEDVPLNVHGANLLSPSMEGTPYEGIQWHDDWFAEADAGYSPETADARRGGARPMPSSLPGPLPMRHSFTTLIRSDARQMASEEGPGADEDVVSTSRGSLPAVDNTQDSATAVEPLSITATYHPELDVLAMVGGVEFGNAVHAILEHRVLGAALAQQAAMVREALDREGVRARGKEAGALVAPLVSRLQGVLDAVLDDRAGLRLGALEHRDLRTEMEFNYALDDVRISTLRAVCELHGEPGLVPGRNQTLAGLMNGKIDLLFAHAGRVHVVDYKSNRLGSGERPCLEDYAPEPIDWAMRRTGYRFQALLYVVAVERYLRERLGGAYRRDRHLGDCWYLFIRAVGLRLPDSRPCGVWRHRFSDGLLDAVQAIFDRPSIEGSR